MPITVTHTDTAPLGGGAKIGADEWNASHDVSGAVASDPTGITGASALTNIVSISQEDYDAIGTPSATTLYVIV